MLSELFNDTYKTSSGETGESRLTIMEAAAVASSVASEPAAEEGAVTAPTETAPTETATEEAAPPAPVA